MKIRKNGIFEGCRKGKADQKRAFYLYLGVSDVQVRGVKMPHGMLFDLQPDGFLAGGGGGVFAILSLFLRKAVFWVMA